MRRLNVGLLLSCLVLGACDQRPGSMPAAGEPASATNAEAAASAQGGNSQAAGTAGEGAQGAAAEKSAWPVWKDVTIPAGTSLPIVLDTAVGSDTSRVEEKVTAHIATAVMVDGMAAVPQDSLVTGVVTDAIRAGKVKGRAHLALRFDTLVPHGQDERYELQTTAVGRTAESEKKKDAVKIGAPAAGGAVIGGIIGGKKGAVIGGAVGGGAGTAVVMTDRGNEVRLAKGAALTLRLSEPLTIRVRAS